MFSAWRRWSSDRYCFGARGKAHGLVDIPPLLQLDLALQIIRGDADEADRDNDVSGDLNDEDGRPA